jgi:hypothetical protein
MRLPVQRSAHSPLVAALALAALAFATSGCAIGNTHTFNYRPDPGENVGNGKVVVVFEVEDLRKDILEGDEPLSWVRGDHVRLLASNGQYASLFR